MHYLEAELTELLREDPATFAFVEAETLDGMWYWDLEKPEHEWMGPGFWRLFGHEPEQKQHLASEWQEMIHPDDLAAALKNFHAHCEDPDVPYDQVVRYTHADGSTVWVRCRGKVIRGENGKPRRMLGCHTNLTEVMNRQKELNAFIEALPGIAVILDRQGTYQKIMPTNEQLLADSVDSLLGSRVPDVLPEEAARPIMETVHRVLDSDQPEVIEYRLKTQTSTLWFEGRIVPLGPASGATDPRVIWMAHDITERKVTAQDLERRNEDLMQFAYVASHDLQSPLNSIRQLTEWLEEDCGDSIGDDGKEFLHLIRTRTVRMSELIQGLLRYAMTSEVASMQDVRPEEIMQAALEMNHVNSERFEVHQHSEVDVIHSDPLLLQQILQNLIGNSLKHHDGERGRIDVVVKGIKDGHMVTVTDDGPGIPEEFQDRVFRAFQTLKPRDEVEASGMGLAIVQKSVRALAGHVKIESDGSTGTSVHVFLPSNPDAARADQVQA